MLVSEAYPSKYLKAADLRDRNVMVVIDRVEIEDIGDDTKPVVYFQGKEKGLCLNKTNANNIAIALGDDTQDWIGKEIILFPAMVDFQGRTVPAVRVRMPTARDRGTRAPAHPPRQPPSRQPAAAARQAEPEPSDDQQRYETEQRRGELDDEIPF